jgi:phospholipid/cholesterol/gamma-HCH transport system permease protein
MFNIIGDATLKLIQEIGGLFLFALQAIRMLFTRKFYFRSFAKYLLEVGFFSLPVVGITALFTGAVLALQSYTGFSRMHAEGAIASVVVLSITRELGPVMAALMLAGRLSASIAAEVGTMRVSEQIDALYTLKVNPISYLVVPKLLAGIIMLPVATLIADVLGVFGGYLIAIYKIGFSPHIYLKKTFDFVEWHDVNSGLIKAAVFGFIICLSGCYQGYKCQNGAFGVGVGTTQAVVSASILILLFNYIITGVAFSR